MIWMKITFCEAFFWNYEKCFTDVALISELTKLWIFVKTNSGCLDIITEKSVLTPIAMASSFFCM